jgi:hypothetical protein
VLRKLPAKHDTSQLRGGVDPRQKCSGREGR